MVDVARLVQLVKRAWSLDTPRREALVREVQEEDAELGANLIELLDQLIGEADESHSSAEIDEEDRSRVAPRASSSEGPRGSDFASEMIQRLAGRGALHGRYTLKGEIARGGQGAILRVWDEDLCRHLAMKVVLGRDDRAAEDTSAVDSRTLGRFLEEARVTGQLDHPGIVPVHELGLDDRGRVYFTMKLVKGRELKTIFDLVHEQKEGWTLTRALRVLLKVCEAMAYAHSKGVIHRDLKPGNVMVGKFGEVYVMDWGLARVTGRRDHKDVRIKPPGTTAGPMPGRRGDRDEAPESPLVTMEGDVVGTPAYMSPEQARGELDAMGPHSDVYSVGAMLYHLLTGQVPYVPREARLNNYAVWARVQEGPPGSIAELAPGTPPELVAICEKAMMRYPALRYQEMSALAEQLEAYLEGRVVRTYESGAWAEARKWLGRNPSMAAAIATMLLLVVFGGLGSFRCTQSSWRETAERERALAERESARWRAYVASVSGAGSALENEDVAGVRFQLDAAPEESRGWEWEYLRAATDNSQLVLEGHSKRISAVAFSPDGSRIVTASADATARVWDARSGAELAVFRGHGALSSATFSPDGARVLTASEDGTARTWDASTGAQILQLAAHTDGLESAAFAPDGARIATASRDRTVRVWDAASGEQLLILSHPRETRNAVFSPDGSRIVSWCWAGAHSWDAASGEELLFLGNGRPGPDGCSILVRSFPDETCHVRQAVPGAEPVVLRGAVKSGQVMASSPDGSRILTGGNGPVQVWSAVTGDLQLLLQGRTAALDAAFSPDGARIVTAHHDGTARVWNAATGEQIGLLAGHADAVELAAFSPDGARIATASADSTVRVWDACEALATGWAAEASSAALDPDGFRIVTTTDGVAQVWAATSGQLLLRLQGHRSLQSAAFSPDGSRILTTSAWEPCARVWDALTGAQLLVLCGDEAQVSSASFSADGLRIVTCAEGAVQLWNAITGEELGTLGRYGEVRTATLDSDCTRVLTTSRDRPARVWDVATGRLLAELRGGESLPTFATFSPDGSRIVTASPEPVARVWDAATGTQVSLLSGHTRSIASAAFAPDGTRIVTSSDDGTTRIWDATSSEQLLVLRGSGVRAQFSPDGTRVVVSSRNGGVRIHDAVPRSARYRDLQEVEAALPRARELLDSLRRVSGDRKSLGDVVRDPALPAALRHAASALVSQEFLGISEWIAELLQDELMWEAVRSAIQQDTDHLPEVREAALAIASASKDDLWEVNQRISRIASDPARPQDAYRKALRAAELAFGTGPSPRSMNTLGAARFRCGLLEEAAEMLERSRLKDPKNLAFLAMTRFRLGEADEARQVLAELRLLLTSFDFDDDELALLAEAEALVSPR